MMCCWVTRCHNSDSRGDLHPPFSVPTSRWVVPFACLSDRGGVDAFTRSYSREKPRPCCWGTTAAFCSHFVNVATDDLAAGYALTQHLLQLGHRRIAFLAGPPATPWSRERFEGLSRARFVQAGLDVDERLVFSSGPDHGGRCVKRQFS
jgi:hypothetical protein